MDTKAITDNARAALKAAEDAVKAAYAHLDALDGTPGDGVHPDRMVVRGAEYAQANPVKVAYIILATVAVTGGFGLLLLYAVVRLKLGC